MIQEYDDSELKRIADSTLSNLCSDLWAARQMSTDNYMAIAFYMASEAAGAAMENGKSKQELLRSINESFKKYLFQPVES